MSLPADVPVVLIGAGETAEIAYEYFTHDSDHTVVAFSVEAEFMEGDSLLGLPLVPLQELAVRFDPSEYAAFVAVSSTQLNHVRARLFKTVKGQGFHCASYISSRSFVWHNAEIGENAFIFENNVLQHNVRIGNDVVLWSGNHIGHRSVIHDHCFISSHVVVSGYCEIGESSFVGVNATFVDGVTVGRDCFIGAGALVLKDLAPRGVYIGSPARATGRDPLEGFDVAGE